MQRLRASRAGRVLLKVVVGVVGALVVGLGIVLLPLPGPGWLVIFAGFGIWTIEFPWAKRLFHFVNRHRQRWTVWLREQPRSTRIGLGVVVLILAVAVIWLSVKVTIDEDLTFRTWL
jgi:uncharacterized protein (TIGR02611 family)